MSKLRKLRRFLSRSEWAVRLLAMPRTPEAATAPGLILIQIDGFSRTELEKALAAGRMPFCKRLLEREGYCLRSLYSGLPSSTPAVQGELFYGVRTAVPAFQFRDRDTGALTSMLQPETAESVEARLAREGEPLLQGGSAYADVYTGGAEETSFCTSGFGPSHLLRHTSLFRLATVLPFYAFILVRSIGLLAAEWVLALSDVVRGIIDRQNLLYEVAFIPKRIAIVVLLRELAKVGIQIDATRGVPVIHANFLGYDEQAHRRGASSAFAHWTLKGIDHAIRRIWSVARRSQCRDYDLWIYSDHGQEDALPYPKAYCRSIQDAVAAVLARHGLRGRPHQHPRGGETARRRVLVGGRRLQALLNRPQPGHVSAEVEVAGMGSVGHVYLPEPPAAAQRGAIARALVEEAHVPAVLFVDDDEGVHACTEHGTHLLPDGAADILGADHPFRDAAGEDLAALARHPDAGVFVLLGWQPRGRPLTFPVENGAHAGPGRKETHAFAVLPQGVRPSREDEWIRPADLRKAAQRHLHRTTGRCTGRAKPAEEPGSPSPDEARLRVMTYNTHSCVGLDGKVSPERVARVIARYRPHVIALQELDAGRVRTGGIDQAQSIARVLEMEYHFHPSLVFEEERYGNAIVSSLPIRLVRTGALPARGRSEPRSVLWVEAEWEGRTIQILNTHLGLRTAERREQADHLTGREWMRDPRFPSLCICCADLNAPPGSAEHRTLTAALQDATQIIEQPADRRTWLGVRQVDYVFVSPAIRVLQADMPRTYLTRVASDHYPLVVDLALPEAASAAPAG